MLLQTSFQCHQCAMVISETAFRLGNPWLDGVPFPEDGFSSAAVDSWVCRELDQGISLTDRDGNKVGQSPIAAQRAISQVIFSRIAMAVPSMGTCI